MEEYAAAYEFGRVEGFNPENLQCVCGNTAEVDGFVWTDAWGVALDDGAGPDHMGLVPWPEDGSEIHSLCVCCGRLFQHLPILDGDVAPVSTVVDLYDPHVGLALAVARENERHHRRIARGRPE